jgi:hypothetical protein
MLMLLLRFSYSHQRFFGHSTCKDASFVAFWKTRALKTIAPTWHAEEVL